MLKSQQSGLPSVQQTDTSQQAGASTNPNIDNTLFRLGTLSAIKDTKPSNPKINNKFFFIIIPILIQTKSFVRNRRKYPKKTQNQKTAQIKTQHVTN